MLWFLRIVESGMLFLMVFSVNAYSKEVVISKRAQQLNYPAFPESLLERASMKPKISSPKEIDSMMSQQWGLLNIGFFDSFSPTVNSTSPQIHTCSPSVIVAVVDTGIDYTHPELQDSLYVNSGEVGPWKDPTGKSSCTDKSCNGIDDDGNGFVDDVSGWDFVHDVAMPYDTHGHGTHIAGIIASKAGNGMGTTGICPEVTIMPLKYYDNSGIGYNNLQNTVRAFQYAVKNGAHIINYSGGGADPALTERIAVEMAQKKGVLFIAAAGNDGHDNAITPYYPASYPLDNIISVASLNKQNQLLPSSNFGKTVMVGAPGLTILSTLPSGRFGTMSGTSQATAFVTGAAALLASQYKNISDFDYKQVKRWILEGSKSLKNNETKNLVSSGLLSVPGSLEKANEDIARDTVPSIALSPEAGSKIKKIQ